MTASRTATLTFSDGTPPVEFPILDGTVGPIGRRHPQPLRPDREVHLRPGLHVDGRVQIGHHLHRRRRGHPALSRLSDQQLAEQCDFLEVCHLLLKGELPTLEQKKSFDNNIRHHTMVHEQLARFFTGFRRDAHPMAVMVGVVGALSAFYHDSLDINNPEHREISAIRLLAKVPTIAAMCYKYNMGQPFMYPRNSLNYVENFLHMMFGTPAEEYVQNPVLVRALDRILILHADHEQNASTSTVRLAGSSGANPFACIAAGIACLWGPAHGGANEAVLNMLAEIGDVSRIGQFIKRAKDKNDNFRLMGFGHRVYKNYDPRAKLMRETCHEVLGELGLHDDRLFKLAHGAGAHRAGRSSISSRKSSIRMWISIRASCSARWAFRPACSPRSSRSRARSAGSRSGTR